jgi:hypothetical protein
MQTSKPTQSKLLPKWVRVLNALRRGVSVNLNDIRVELIETEDGRTLLAHPITRLASKNNSTETKVYLPLDLTVNDFIAACEQLDEIDIPIVIPTISTKVV